MNNMKASLAVALSLVLVIILAMNGSTFAAIEERASYILTAASYQFSGKAENTKQKLDTAGSTIPTNKTDDTAQKRLVGYYAAWASYTDFTPDRIDASKLTHINYAFANIGSDLKITMGYPERDSNNFKRLNQLKKDNPALKTLISIGGWTWSGRFSDAALTDTSRAAFADSCVAFMKKHGFDGVDIDWEYPVSGGLSGNSKRSADKRNFTLLLQVLREKLDAQGSADQKHYLLTIAAGAGSSYLDHIELSAIQPYLDYVTLMTYDIHGTWDTYTDHHAPLYAGTGPSPQYKASVDSSIRAWEKASFPKDKLVMGIPFYGYLYSNVTNINYGLRQTFHGANSISYQQIERTYLRKAGYRRYFDQQSKVPWLFNGSSFISYEDPESIESK
ncbi:MAG: glycoside hydrolase family 18 protein, partial [Eubacteriales bacterium]|nr:glycoside hydrolase family 18 protein [Eubacteriales bacterium]